MSLAGSTANPINNERPIDVGFFLAKFAERSKEIFWIRSPDYRRQLFVSPSYAEIWGRSCESLYKNSNEWLDYVHPEDKPQLEVDIKKRIPYSGQEGSFLTEYRCIRPDGSIRWIRDETFPVYNDHQEHIGFAGIAQDITRQKYLEQQHQQINSAVGDNDAIGHVLKKLADRSRDVFWIRSVNYSQQLFVSPSFELIWGRPCKELYKP